MTEQKNSTLHPYSPQTPNCNRLERFCRGIGELIINSHHDPVVSGPTQPICNRDQAGKFRLPEDGYYHLVPRGEYANHHHRTDGTVETIIQVYDDAAFTAMVNRFKDEQLINYEHHAHDPSQPRGSASGGWIEDLQVRDDGLYGRIRWSASGEADVTGGNYRYVSPEHPRAAVEPLGGNRYRILELTGAALTNKHNLKGLKPLSNRNHQNTMNEPLKQKLLKFFGLGPDADESAIQAAIPEEQTLAALKNRDKEDKPEKEDEVLQNRVKSLTKELADRDLEAYADVILPDQKDVVREQLLTNRESAIKMLKAMRRGGSAAGREDGTIFNRASARPPSTQDALDKSAAAEEAQARKISARTDEILKNREGVSLSEAWREARSEVLAGNSGS